jgi:iron complex outermembrane receptor protein
MYWKNALFLFILNILSTEAFVQCDLNVTGYVYEKSSKVPLPYANVQILKTEIGTTTDENGFFEFSDLCEREYDIKVSYVGYKTMIHHHDFHHPETLNFYLAFEDELLDGVVIEGKSNKSSFSTSTLTTLTKEQLELLNTESSGEIFRQLSGVNALNTGQNISKPIIHGLHSNRILIIDEDVKHQFQNWSEDHAPEIDLSDVDIINVIKGASSVRYGPDALGGVVLLQKQKVNLSTPLRGSFQLTGKSNGKALVSQASLKKGFSNWTMDNDVSFTRQGDLSAPDYVLSNTGKREKSLASRISMHLRPELDINVSGSYIEQELGILRGAVNGNLEDLLNAIEAEIPNDTRAFTYQISSPKQKLKHLVLRTNAKYTLSKQVFNIQYNFQRNVRQEFDVRKGNDLEIPNIDLLLKTHNFDIEWQFIGNESWNSKSGFQWSNSENDNLPGTNTVPFIPNYLSQNLGVYTLQSITSGNQEWEFGIRLDNYVYNVTGRAPNNDIFRDKLSYTNFSGIVGWKKEINDRLTFRSNFGTAWRPPNIAELYRFGRRGTFIEYGLLRYGIENDGTLSTSEVFTQEEKAIPSEIGYKWINTLEYANENISYEATMYVNFIDNYIYARSAGVSRTVRGAAPFFIYFQRDVIMAGTDVTFRWRSSVAFNQEINGSFIFARETANNQPISNIPPPNIDYKANYSFSLFKVNHSLALNTRYTFRQFDEVDIIPIEELLSTENNGINFLSGSNPDFDIQEPPSGYLLFNMSLLSKWEKITLLFKINNIFNQSYRNYNDRIRYFANDLGRNVSLSLKYSFD